MSRSGSGSYLHRTCRNFQGHSCGRLWHINPVVCTLFRPRLSPGTGGYPAGDRCTGGWISRQSEPVEAMPRSPEHPLPLPLSPEPVRFWWNGGSCGGMILIFMDRNWKSIWSPAPGDCRGCRSIRIGWWDMGYCAWAKGCLWDEVKKKRKITKQCWRNNALAKQWNYTIN